MCSSFFAFFEILSKRKLPQNSYITDFELFQISKDVLLMRTYSVILGSADVLRYNTRQSGEVKNAVLFSRAKGNPIV